MDYIVLVNFDDPINNMRKDVKVVLSILFKRHVFWNSFRDVIVKGLTWAVFHLNHHINRNIMLSFLQKLVQCLLWKLLGGRHLWWHFVWRLAWGGRGGSAFWGSNTARGAARFDTTWHNWYRICTLSCLSSNTWDILLNRPWSGLSSCIVNIFLAVSTWCLSLSSLYSFTLLWTWFSFFLFFFLNDWMFLPLCDNGFSNISRIVLIISLSKLHLLQAFSKVKAICWNFEIEWLVAALRQLLSSFKTSRSFLSMALDSFNVIRPVIYFNLFFIFVKFFKPAIKVSNNILWWNLWSCLQFSIYSMLIDFVHGINIFWLQDMQPYYLDGILFLINMISRFKYFSEATLTNFVNVFEFL